MNRKQKLEPVMLKTGRGTDALFGDNADQAAAAEFVDRQDIVLPANQPRRYFSSVAMEQLIASIKAHGILSPLIVRPINDHQYELVAGERRYRAATTLDLKQVPVVIKNLTDTEALEFALLENLSREDLNPVEETESILEFLSRKLALDRNEVIKLFSQTANEHRESAHNVMRSDEWVIIESVFAKIGRLTAASFRANRLPLLKLPEDILEALRAGHIEYTKAKEIAKLKDSKQREALLTQAIETKMSLSQIREAINRIKEKRQDDEALDDLKQRATTVFNEAKRAKIWLDNEKKTQLEDILQQLEVLLRA